MERSDLPQGVPTKDTFGPKSLTSFMSSSLLALGGGRRSEPARQRGRRAAGPTDAVLKSSVSGSWMQRCVEGATGFQHAVANMQELPHGRPDDNHLFFAALLEPVPECLDRRVTPQSGHRRKAHRAPKPSVSYLRHPRSSSHGGPGLVMAWNQACIRGCLAGTLKSVRGPELADNDRGGLQSHAGNRGRHDMRVAGAWKEEAPDRIWIHRVCPGPHFADSPLPDRPTLVSLAFDPRQEVAFHSGIPGLNGKCLLKC